MEVVLPHEDIAQGHGRNGKGALQQGLCGALQSRIGKNRNLYWSLHDETLPIYSSRMYRVDEDLSTRNGNWSSTKISSRFGTYHVARGDMMRSSQNTLRSPITIIGSSSSSSHLDTTTPGSPPRTTTITTDDVEDEAVVGRAGQADELLARRHRQTQGKGGSTPKTKQPVPVTPDSTSGKSAQLWVK